MATCSDILLTWLNNAYAMEKSIMKTLEGHAEDAGELPEVQEMIRGHIEQTENQKERVRAQIEKLGGDVSEIKEMGAVAMGVMQGVATSAADDKLVKNAIAEHATEHFEMATYQSIQKAAELCGDEGTAQMAREIIHEEKVMGDKTKNVLPMVVEAYLATRTAEE